MSELNDFMVAMSPESEVIYESDKMHFEISLAEHEGKWAFGYDYRYPIGGGGSAPAFSENRELFETRKAARAAAVERIKWILEQIGLGYPEEAAKVRKAISEKEEPQMTLF